ncbi:hypothetical protein TpMuguga_02g00898 [Theileria parva strain Muguga]|uniref:Uncharacterized protein n=1 Tax=Theileria parva TaxID=5875 RepID=Q4N3U0_THEPA|nr:uncharacterized protein TpMuguga_02g00898 [Theileria parva strain Muguga]EAN33183.1 hypothetical protein TpMuguga_02g00898 [Theileria parva strain Muguga]|eukprot:XP_765466.1 hypothetical protein [Theileria parva strain Muguga]
MVWLVPPFLRNIIGSAEDNQHVTSNHENKPEPPEEDIKSSKDPNLNPFDPLDSPYIIKDEQLKGLGITSNIATIASIDWGPPKLNATLLDDLGNSGKHLLDMIRGNKTTVENLEDITKNIKTVPKVYESDFNVYLNQIEEIYSECPEFNILKDKLADNIESPSVLVESSIDNVSREYFEDDYNIHENIIFNKTLDKIPESIEFLESQLMQINTQLRELVGTHLKHVGQSFVCIEDLKTSFVNVNDQISNVRSIFDNLKGIYNSPVNYSQSKESKINQDDISPSSARSMDSQTSESKSYTLHEVLMYKKRILEVLDYLHLLKGISCTPEYIQGIIEINNMALARIFAYVVIQYFENDLSKFKITNSVSLVLKDTISNLEQVGEAKFIDLTFFALTECYSCDDMEKYEKELRPTLEKIEPVLIVLTISGSISDTLSTLKNTPIIPINYSTESPVTMDSFQEHLDKVLRGFKHSNLFLLHLLNSLTCVYLFKKEGQYLPDSSKSSEIGKKMILKIHDSFTDGINRDYQKIAETTQFLKNQLKLPMTCKSGPYSEMYLKFLINSDLDEETKESVGNSDVNAQSTSTDIDNHGDSANDENKSSETEDKIATDLCNYYENLYFVMEGVFVKALENLFSSFKIETVCGEAVTDIDSVVLSLKEVEKIYKETVKNYTKCPKATEKMLTELLKKHLKYHKFQDGVSLQFVEKDLGSVLTEVLHRYISAESKKNIELVFEQNLVKVHEDLNQETWDVFEKLELEGKTYNLIHSSIRLNEHLDVYFGISEKFSFLSSASISKSINLFAYFSTLIENELEKNLCVKKLCLIIQTLDFFTFSIPLKIRNLSFHTQKTGKSEEDDTKNYDLLLVLGINAENCVMEAKILRKKSAELLSNFIFSQIKIHLINWVFKYTDLQDNTQSEDPTEDVNLVIKTITDLYSECSQIFSVEDLKETFADSFDKLVDLAKKQNLDFTKFDKFSDDCSRIMTELSHLSDIKLEILSLAHRLSN